MATPGEEAEAGPPIASLPLAVLLEVAARLTGPDLGRLVAAHPRLFSPLRSAITTVHLPPPWSDPRASRFPSRTALRTWGAPLENRGHRLSTVVTIRRLACRRLFPRLSTVVCHPAARADGTAVLFGAFQDLPNAVEPPLRVSGCFISISQLVRPRPNPQRTHFCSAMMPPAGAAFLTNQRHRGRLWPAPYAAGRAAEILRDRQRLVRDSHRLPGSAGNRDLP